MYEALVVGREREIGSIIHWLDRTAAGRGTTGLISGEPGAGKSCLLEVAADLAHERGFVVAWGRAWEISSAPPHWPWIEVLRTLRLRPGGQHGAAALLALLPELDHGSTAAPTAESFPLHDAVVGYLQAAAERAPLLVILDDLHAADPSSLRLAEIVAARIRGTRVALLGAYRDVEARLSPEIENALALLGRHGDALALPRLGCDGVAAQRGAVPARPMRRTANPVIELVCEGEFWTVRGFGQLCRIKDSRGIQMLARLTTSPHQAIHVLELSGAELVDGGDAGVALDASARDAYRDRIHELRSELAQAEAWNDAGRSERIQREIDSLCAQLAGAFGLGARPRRTGAAAERARQNVRRRIADAMQRITAACPEIGRHLERTVRTGTACTYEPDR
jgi:ABC-type cobalamin/Fe3+-siderophores transport system ATPase subunit